MKSQKPAVRQSSNAYFLDLNIELASKFQILKNQARNIKNYYKAASSGAIGPCTLDRGKLETEFINSRAKAEQMHRQLESFQVHPQYTELSVKANSLTEEIRSKTNDIMIKEQLISLYKLNWQEDNPEKSSNELHRLYEEAGVVFPGNIKTALEEVSIFHKTLISKRREYLENEISKLNEEISELAEEIENLTADRAHLLKIL
jgi:uncharacterized protein YydD (DUF2326 family)